MGENSKIEWTDHTFNPWEGCAKVSTGCKNCYAETRDRRWHNGNHWGPQAPRKIMSLSNWRKPHKWDKQAALHGRKVRVFCGSLCDVFEDRPDLTATRRRLFDVIAETRNLTWLLLTKRPDSAREIIIENRIRPRWPANAFLGVSVENRDALKRVDALMKLKGNFNIPKIFLSVEPLLEDLGGFSFAGIDWVIVGGESGRHCRNIKAPWVRRIRDNCVKSGVPFFFKQWGGLSKGAVLDGMEWREVPGE